MARSDFGDREDLERGAALDLLSGQRLPSFASERDYREWFVVEALPDLIPHLTGGVPLMSFEVEQKLPGGSARIDVIARSVTGDVFGFELKAANRKNPQTARYALMQGIGQALLYQDCLSVRHGRFVPVSLVSDIVFPDVASLMLRHGLMVGLIEANAERIVCMLNGAAVSLHA